LSLLERVEAARRGVSALPVGTAPPGGAPLGGAPPGGAPPDAPAAPEAGSSLADIARSAPASPAGASAATIPNMSRPLVAIPIEGRAAPATRPTSRDLALREIRMRLADEVANAWSALLDLSNVAQVRRKIASIVDELVDDLSSDRGLVLRRDERTRLIDEVLHDVVGFGPIEPLLADDTITEVMVNGPHKVYIERAGKIEKVAVTFRDDQHVLHVIDRIITPIGRRIDESSPRVDARLPDGSRVNAIIKPLSLVGPVITVRKFAARYTVDDLIRFGTASPEMFDFLRACIEARLNVFLSGGTGSGKTTTLNVLSSFIPEDERIITIEDAAELLLSQRHVVTLEARPANLEGLGEITIRDLLRNALHMRPDRIIVGECRAGEALDMIQAMTTGQEGSLSTGHANTPRDMLRRIETMILMTGYELPLRAIREQIASAVDLIVHTARLRDGSRKIVSITEVYGIEDEDILTQEIFTYQQTGVRDGRIEGFLAPTGIRPTFMGAFRIRGIGLPPGEFGIPPEDPAQPAGRPGKSRWGGGAMGSTARTGSFAVGALGLGRAVTAGGMVYVSSVGPVDPETGRVRGGELRDQARQCLENLKARLEEAGSSLERIVWANWSLRDPAEFDSFYEEWLRWFPGDAPVGQGTMLPLAHRRAGFRVSIGVIASL
jgi:pilus assembly protein CpaF